MRIDQPFVVNDWTVEPDLNRLVRGNDSKSLRPQVMNLLVYLAHRPGAVARTDELMRELWPKRIVTDATLYNCISELRQALEDGKDGRRFVQTVHKKGYRLCAEVSLLRETGSDQQQLPTDNPEARQALLLGDQRMARRNLEGWKQAEQYYRRAIELDPDCSVAWQKLAESIVAQFGTFEKPVTELPEALTAAQRSIELDEQNGLAWISTARAEEALAVAEHRTIPRQRLHELHQRGIELLPDSAVAAREYGFLLLRSKGQGAMAIELLEKSVAMDPLSGDGLFALGSAYRLSGQFGAALSALQRSLELQPDNPYPIWEIGLTYYAVGELGNALAWGIRALEYERDDPSGPFLLAQVAMNLDRLDDAEDWVARGLRSTPDVPIAAAAQMALALAANRTEVAWEFAERVVPHTGEMRIVNPGAAAQALWILRDRDMHRGRPEDALDRYGHYVPGLLDETVAGEDLWLTAAVDLAYLFGELGETGRSRCLLEAVQKAAAGGSSAGVREIDTRFLEIEATALLGNVATAKRMLRERIDPGWVRWWNVLATRPTSRLLVDGDEWRTVEQKIATHRARERDRYREISSAGTQ